VPYKWRVFFIIVHARRADVRAYVCKKELCIKKGWVNEMQKTNGRDDAVRDEMRQTDHASEDE
jgi:hypothetical protein